VNKGKSTKISARDSGPATASVRIRGVVLELDVLLFHVRVRHTTRRGHSRALSSTHVDVIASQPCKQSAYGECTNAPYSIPGSSARLDSRTGVGSPLFREDYAPAHVAPATCA
jgi:hypothetical protein